MILVTGGNGLLGMELRKIYINGIYPTHGEMDIEKMEEIERYLDNNGRIRSIIHAAAYTNTVSCERDIESQIKAIKTNIIGTSNIVIACMNRGMRLIYISTDYVFSGEGGDYREGDDLNPINKYAWTKLGGESAVRLYDKSLIIRTTFCANEFPYNKAFGDQYTSRESVKEIASKMIKVIDNEDIKGIVHIGGEKKTVYELAKKLNLEKEIGVIKREEVLKIGYRIPRDTTLNTDRYNNC